MNVLGIETTCDETAVAIVRDGKDILANCIASQAKLHEQYGGVFPEMASRQHIDQLLPLVEVALKQAQLTSDKIDLVAVANGPGLMGALLMGVTAAKGLSFAWEKPLVGVNHVEAHLYSAMMTSEHEPIFPALGIVLSGGHTFLAKMNTITDYSIIATTVDDAIGEAFDKVATLLGLPYPGGPHIEKLALKGDDTRFPFKAGQVKKRPLDFSFSGLKTNVLYTVKGPQANRKAPDLITEADKKDVAASFQQVAFSDIVSKAIQAAQTFPCQGIYLGGGVTNNQRLKTLFEEARSHLPIYWPPKELTLDNGAMIAGLGYHLYQKKPEQELAHPFPRLIYSCS